MPPPHLPADARSRLEQAPDAYRLALDLADRLDERGLDLWAAGVRACLDAAGSTDRQRHLAAELTRLSTMSMVRSEGLQPPIGQALARLRAGLGDTDVEWQPLYGAARDLADHLQLGGGRRWIARLRAVLEDVERTAAARLVRLDLLLARMREEALAPADPALPLPEGTSARIDAVTTRTARHRDAEEVVRYLRFALRPPRASRAVPLPGSPVPAGADDGLSA